MISVEEYVLTFPDGRVVGEGELEEWLAEINASSCLDQDQRDVAKAIVWRIRALAN